MEKQKDEIPEKKENHHNSQPNKGLLVLISILFVISLLLTVSGFDLYRVMFDSTRVKDLLFSEIRETNLVPAVLENFSLKRANERIATGEALSGVSEPDIPLLLSFMQMEDWIRIRDLLLEDEFVSHLVSVSVDGTYAWIDSKDLIPQIVWRMDPLKEALVGEPGRQSIMVGYDSLPQCTEEQMADFTARLAASPPGVEVLYNLCAFPPPWEDDQIDDYTNALIDVNNNIPIEYSFSSMLENNQVVSTKSVALLKSLLKGIRFFGQWGWVVTLLLLGLIILVTRRSFKRMCGWIGVPLVVSGGVLLVQYLLSKGLIYQWLMGLILSQTSDMVRQEVAASLTRLAAEVNRPLLLQLLIILVLGIGLLVLRKVVKGKHESGSLEQSMK
mgnify:FL=1